MSLIFLLALVGCGSSSQVGLEDPRDRCTLEKRVEFCYEVGLVGADGRVMPDEFGKPVPLTMKDADFYLGLACKKDHRDACQRLGGLIQQGAKADRVLAALFLPCSEGSSSACRAILKVNLDHPNTVEPKMLAYAQEAIGSASR